MDNKGEISGYYDLRIPIGSDVGRTEEINRAIRNCFFRNNGRLDKELMDKTIKAVGKNSPDYKTIWAEFKKTFEIKVKDGVYINPFHVD